MENAENAGSLQDEIFTEQSTEQIALRAENLRKTFRLSAKQRKSEKTAAKEKVAVDGLSFTVKKAKSTVCSARTAREKPQRSVCSPRSLNPTRATRS